MHSTPRSSSGQDYDLCAECEAHNTSLRAFGAVHAPTHALLKIRQPSQVPIAVRAVPFDAPTPDGRREGSPWRGGRHLLRALLSNALGGPSPKHTTVGGHHSDRSVHAPDALPDAEAQAALASLAARAVASGAPQASEAGGVAVVGADAYAGLSARFVSYLAPHEGPGPGGVCSRPGASLVRAWRVVNGGVRPWPTGTALVYVGCRPEGAWGGTGGAPFPAPGGVPVPCATPGAFVDIALPLTAPRAPGRYIAYFRLEAPPPVPPPEAARPSGSEPDSSAHRGDSALDASGMQGLRFGHQLRADLLVE